MMPEMFMRSPLPLRTTILIAGVAVSCALAIGGALAMPPGGTYGPSFSDTSAALFAGFFLLNPVHLLLIALPLPRAPDFVGAILAVTVDLGWWWLVSGVVARLIQKRRAAKVRATE